MASYGDPYSNNRYQNYASDSNPPYQDFDNTGPTYDPYRTGHNVHFQDNDTPNDERPPTPPSKFEDGAEASTPARQQSTRSVARGASLKKDKSMRLSVVPVRKHYNGFEHGEFTPVTPRRSVTNLISLFAYLVAPGHICLGLEVTFIPYSSER